MAHLASNAWFPPQRCDERVPQYDVALLSLETTDETPWAFAASERDHDSALASETPRGVVLGWGQLHPSDPAPSPTLQAKAVRLYEAPDGPLTTAQTAAWRGLLVGSDVEGSGCRGDSGGPVFDVDDPSLLLGVVVQQGSAPDSALDACANVAAVPAWRIVSWLEAR